MAASLGDFGVQLIGALSAASRRSSRSSCSTHGSGVRWDDRERGRCGTRSTSPPPARGCPRSTAWASSPCRTCRWAPEAHGQPHSLGLPRHLRRPALRPGGLQRPGAPSRVQPLGVGQAHAGDEQVRLRGRPRPTARPLPVAQRPTSPSGKGVVPPSQAPPQKPVWDPQAYASQVLGQYASGGRLDLTQLPGVVGSSFQLPPPPPAASGATAPPGGATAPGAAPIEYKGKELVLPTSWKSTHVTDGLADKGFTHAEDIMGHPGTPVGAPEEGVVMYFHPTGAQGGGSMMIRAASGRTYWLGHIADGVPAGTKVTRGQRIATISGDHPRPHVHIDWSTSYAG